METMRKISRRYYLRHIIVWLMVNLMFFGLPVCSVLADPNPGADAVPTIDNVLSSSTALDFTGSNALNSVIGSAGTSNVINWNNFDIGSNAGVTFTQDGGWILNNVNAADGMATGINGGLSAANCGIIIKNQLGIVFGPTALVQAQSFAALGLSGADNDILNAFANGDALTLGVGGAKGNIIVEEGAVIQAQEMLALIGKNVINRGLLQVTNPGALMLLAAGEEVYIQENGSSVTVKVAGSGPGANILDNGGNMDGTGPGMIDASGGDVVLAAGDMYSTAIEGVQSLTAKAKGHIRFGGSVETTNGDIYMQAAEKKKIIIDGDVTANNGDILILANGPDPVGPGQNQSANVEISGSVTATGSDIFIKGEDVLIGGPVNADGELALHARHDIVLDSDVQSGGDMELLADRNFGYGGDMTAGGDVTSGGKIDVQGNQINFGGDVDAQGGDLTVKARTSNDTSLPNPFGWGNVDVAENKTLKASGDIIITDDSKPAGEGTLEVRGHKNLYMDAGGDISIADYVLIVEENGAGTSAAAMIDIKAGGDVTVEDRGKVIAGAEVAGSGNADSTINVEAGGDFRVLGDSDVLATADADHAGNANSAINIAAGENIIFESSGEENHVEVIALAKDGTNNNAGVSLDAGMDVVLSSSKDGEVSVKASTEDGVTNTSAVLVNAGRDVIVESIGGDAHIIAEAFGAEDNTANVDVDAGGNVVVIAMGEDETAAGIGAYAEDADNSNNAQVKVKANNVLVAAAGNGSEAEIEAYAGGINYQESEEPHTAQNNASVDIETFEVEADPEMVAEAGEWLSEIIPPEIAEAIDDMDIDVEGELTELLKGGHVAVIGFEGGDAKIEAETSAGKTRSTVHNNSDVLICAEGVVLVGAAYGADAEIKAISEYGYTNTSNVGIGAHDGLGVIAYGGAEASIASKAMFGYSNKADLVACTGGPLVVLGISEASASIGTEAMYGQHNEASTAVCADSLIVVGAAYGSYAGIYSEADSGGDYCEEPTTTSAETIVVSKNSGIAVVAIGEGEAGISSRAYGALDNDASTSVCAEDHVIVQAGRIPFFEDEQYSGSGGVAYISSRTSSSEGEVSTANAETSVVSRKGSVVVADFTGEGIGEARISSDAYGEGENTAYTGVAAGAELAPISFDWGDNCKMLVMMPPEEDDEPVGLIDWIEQEYRDIMPAGNVEVYAEGPGSSAQIVSTAGGGFENTADTVVCAPGEVSVEAYGPGSYAEIASWAEGDCGADNKATTQVYANRVYVDVENGGISAWASGDGQVDVGSEFYFTAGDEPVYETGENEDSTLIIDSYSNSQDCPECSDCPDCPCDDVPPPPPVPPLDREAGEPLEKFEFEQGGCPALMQWFASELGIGEDQINVVLGNSDFLATDIQPCEACARLKQQANMMADMDAATVDAWAGTVRSGMVGPLTPEMIAGIQTAMADNPAAAGFDNAAAEYVRILSEELGIEADEAMTVAAENYAPDHSDLGAYIGARSGAL